MALVHAIGDILRRSQCDQWIIVERKVQFCWYHICIVTNAPLTTETKNWIKCEVSESAPFTFKFTLTFARRGPGVLRCAGAIPMKDDGHEPAFPQTCVDALEVGMVHTGLSLRDWYAGQVLKALAPDLTQTIAEDPEHVQRTVDMIARISYGVADAMLKARDA